MSGDPMAGNPASRAPESNAPEGRLTPPVVAIVGYTLRACVPPRRRWLLALPCAGAVLFGLLSRLAPEDRTEVFAQVASLGIFSLVLPLACLVLGDAVLGAEVRSGTLGLTWMSPVRFSTIVLGRWTGALLIAAPVLAASGVAAATVAGVAGGAATMALALVAGAAAYLALFLAIGVIARRAAVWSIAVVVIVERLLGTALSGIAQLSPLWQSRAVYAGLGPDGDVLHRGGIPEGWEAVGRLGVIAVVLLALATWRLAHIRLTGAED